MRIAFDAFGTLFDLEALRSSAGDELFDAFQARLQPWTWLATAADAYVPLPDLAELAFQSAAEELGIDADAQALARELTSLPLFPEVPEALDALDGARLGILSNGTREGLEQLLSNAGIRDRFQHVLAADSVARYKPAPEVYGLAPRAFGVHADEVTLVSGNSWDIAGARLAGLRTIWVSRGRPVASVLGLMPDEIVDDLGALTFASRS
jgi:2-haloacid dehalogenase